MRVETSEESELDSGLSRLEPACASAYNKKCASAPISDLRSQISNKHDNTRLQNVPWRTDGREPWWAVAAQHPTAGGRKRKRCKGAETERWAKRQQSRTSAFFM